MNPPWCWDTTIFWVSGLTWLFWLHEVYAGHAGHICNVIQQLLSVVIIHFVFPSASRSCVEGHTSAVPISIFPQYLGNGCPTHCAEPVTDHVLPFHQLCSELLHPLNIPFEALALHTCAHTHTILQASFILFSILHSSPLRPWMVQSPERQTKRNTRTVEKESVGGWGREERGSSHALSYFLNDDDRSRGAC